jgi:hypothetical protein
MWYRNTTPKEHDPWSGLDEPQPTPALHIVAGPGPHPGPDPDPEPRPESLLGEGRWLVALPQTPETTDTGGYRSLRDTMRHRLPTGAWAALATVAAILLGAVAVSIDSGDAGEHMVTTATPPSTATLSEDACTGLSGTLVTDRAGDHTTVPGLIASFQAAYYLRRDAEAAMRLLAPESGITVEGLAAGIVSIPRGTTHCVAITPISATTANVHIVELRAEGQRIDYLQVVNTRPGEDGALLISNIQRQG